METKLFTALAEYGIAMVAVAGLMFLVWYLVRWSTALINTLTVQHREERNEWKDTFVSVSARADERQAETNIILQEFNNARKDHNLFMGGVASAKRKSGK